MKYLRLQINKHFSVVEFFLVSITKEQKREPPPFQWDVEELTFLITEKKD
jgi:hypothetical protein